ncbi:MAG: Flp pilus assembly protein CpaB [Deltaproteobacteria bacterium]|nr:MAG: Flp pilus assembly protein CpaB [Deltaproteobacteria bacterium]
MGKPITIMVIGVVFAAFAGFMTLKFLRGQQATVEVEQVETKEIVVARDTISRGETIEADDVKVVAWPAEAAPEDAFGSPEEVIGKLARTTIYANDPLTNTKFVTSESPSILSMLIPKGHRAISVKVNEVTGISGFVAPGSHVDVLLTVPGTDEMAARTRIILQDVEVLAIAQSVEQQDNKPTVVNTVTLDVTPRQAEVVAVASNEGNLHLVLRNDRDERQVISWGTSITEVIGAKNSSVDGPAVELIRGDERINVTF